MNAQAEPSGAGLAVIYGLASLRATAPAPAPGTRRVPSVPRLCHSGTGHSMKVVPSTGVPGLLAPGRSAWDGISSPWLPALLPFIGTKDAQGRRLRFDLSVKIGKVLASQQNETFLLKTNILPHQESNFLSK